MSGHSKWAQIKRDKGANDAKRGQAFTKLGAAITIAVRQGGGITNPDDNPRLRLAIEKARELNMPRENIERAIEKGAGKNGDSDFQEVLYEGYGPGGFPVLVEAATDNKARTFSEVRNIFDKNGGTMASTGAVSYMFNQVGLIKVEKAGKVLDEVFLTVADFGANDIEESFDSFNIFTSPGDLNSIKKNLESSGYRIVGSEFSRKAINPVLISEASVAKKIINFLDFLEESDDVQKVYSNFEIDDSIVEQISS